MDIRLTFRTSLAVVIRWGDAERYASRPMAMAVNARKVDPIGKSVGSFNTEAQISPVWGKAADSTLSRKSSKENMWDPYLKPTQVDEKNILRRS